jgi:hypothetical protein
VGYKLTRLDGRIEGSGLRQVGLGQVLAVRIPQESYDRQKAHEQEHQATSRHDDPEEHGPRDCNGTTGTRGYRQLGTEVNHSRRFLVTLSLRDEFL